jgi:hypothetical protein
VVQIAGVALRMFANIIQDEVLLVLPNTSESIKVRLKSIPSLSQYYYYSLIGVDPSNAIPNSIAYIPA